MPELMDPSELPSTKGPGVAPSQLIAWLLYPVIFIVGLAVGIIIGIKEGPNLTKNTNTNKNIVYSNVSIIPGTNKTANASNTNTTTNTSSNTNSILRNGDYLKLDATTSAQLDQQKTADLSSLVDQTVSFTDVLRQQDLISLKYNLLTYYAVRGNYPDTSGQVIHLDKSASDTFYSDMKDFYGGTFYEKIDPESPTYYYGYSSDGSTFTLTAYLRSKSKTFTLTNN